MRCFHLFIVVVISLVLVGAAGIWIGTSEKYRRGEESVGLNDKRTQENNKAPGKQDEVPSADLSQGNGDVVEQTPSISNEPTVVPKDCVRRALLIGVDDYAKFNDLKYAVKDVEAIRKKLLELGFKTENIVELKTGASSDFLPTKANIEENLDVLFAESGPDDMIFIDFSGHGFEIDGIAGFAPQDARLSGDANVVELASTVSITDVIRRLKESRSKFKWLVVDACRENPTLTKNASVAARKLKPLTPPPGIVVLQSCGATEYSFEDSKSKLGLFTSKLIEALDGKADVDADGVMTILDVVRYTTEETSAAAKRYFNATQTPFFKADIADFILVDDLERDGLSREERQMGEIALAEADAAVEAEDFERAFAKIDEALTLKPTGETQKSWTAKRVEVENIQNGKAATKEAEALRAFNAGNYDDAFKFLDLAIKLEPKPERKLLKMELGGEIVTRPEASIPNFTFPTKQVRVSTSEELEFMLKNLFDDKNYNNVTIILTKGKYNLSQTRRLYNKTIAICSETGKAEDVQIVIHTKESIRIGDKGAVVFVGIDISGGSHIYIEDNAYVVLRACSLHDSKVGIEVHDGAIAGMINSEITECNRAVELYDNAIGALEDCKLSNCFDGGVYVHESGRLAMINCKIFNNPAGLELQSYRVENKQKIILKDCEISNCEYGVDGDASGSLKMTNCKISGNIEDGVEIGEDMKVEMEECKVFDNNVGLNIENNAVVDLENCEIANCKSDCISIFGSGRLEMRDSQIRGGSCGIYFSSDYATADVSNCNISEYDTYGVEVSNVDLANVAIKDGRFVFEKRSGKFGTFRNNILNSSREGSKAWDDYALIHFELIENTPNE